MPGGNRRDARARNICSVSAHAKLSIISRQKVTPTAINGKRYY
jgi:hypothetical protein